MPNNVLKIDSFLNQQIDPTVMKAIEQEFYAYFQNHGISKVLTIEASGIAPAIMVAAHFDVPMLFAKKALPSTLQKDAYYQTQVHSYTKNTTYQVLVSKQYLSPADRVLIIDDFGQRRCGHGPGRFGGPSRRHRCRGGHLCGKKLSAGAGATGACPPGRLRQRTDCGY